MKLYKHPSIQHLPFSEGLQNDDRRIETLNGFLGNDVVVTEKLDGENTSLYPDGTVHARSVDSRNHPSRNWVKSFWGERSWLLRADHRVCGENMYAVHSIAYTDLDTYFYGFSVWNEETCLSWNDTNLFLYYVDIIPAPVLYQGKFNLKVLEKLAADLDTNKVEGYVVRSVASFTLQEFPIKIAKFVRKGHVQTDEHWMTKPIVPNN